MAVFAATSASADTNFTDLTQQERTVFHAEIRAALLELPHLLPLGLSPLEAEVLGDKARIAAQAARLFDPSKVDIGQAQAGRPLALFVEPDCRECRTAIAELIAVADQYDIRVRVFDLREHTALAHTLGIDMTPFYVFPDGFFRGAMPSILLERY